MNTLSQGAVSAYPYKVAGIDIDGTLVDREKLVSPENVAAVQALRQRGVKVILTTGRVIHQTTPYHRLLGLRCPIVTSDGALVSDPGKRILVDVPLDLDVTTDLLKRADEAGISCVTYSSKGVSETARHDWNEEMDRHRFELAKHFRRCTIKQLGRHRAHKILMYCADKEKLDRFEALALSLHGDRVHHIRNPQYIEFIHSGLSKVSGLQVVCNLYGIQPSEVLFFGDGNNDEPALAWAGCGIAMNHGSQRALSAARFVAPKTDPGTNLAAAIAMVL